MVEAMRKMLEATKNMEGTIQEQERLGDETAKHRMELSLLESDHDKMMNGRVARWFAKTDFGDNLWITRSSSQ